MSTNPISTELEALQAHDAERAKIVRRIENLQLAPLKTLLTAFDTAANKKAIETAQTLVPQLTDGRQGQANQLASGLNYALEYLRSEAARIEAQVAEDAVIVDPA